MKLAAKKCDSTSGGFSLLEVLLASVLGLFLLGIVLQNYLSTKNIYNVEMQAARLSENIQFANYILRQNIMHAGFAGCRKISELNLINHTNVNFSAQTVIHGYESKQLPNYLSGKVASNSDVLIITKANSDITNVVADTKVGVTSIKVKQNPATQWNQLLLISDCVNAELFTAKNWSGNTIISENKLNNSYSARNATASRLEEVAFFISDTERFTDKNQPIYGLYFMINRGNKKELISGIDNMQIIYGIDLKGQGKVTKYLSTAEITDSKLWEKILSVVIILKPWKIYIKLRER